MRERACCQAGMTRATVCQVLAHFTHHEPEDQLPWPWIATLVIAIALAVAVLALVVPDAIAPTL
jgi:hypothetical protein